jgi:hypothetical protein
VLLLLLLVEKSPNKSFDAAADVVGSAGEALPHGLELDILRSLGVGTVAGDEE